MTIAQFDNLISRARAKYDAGQAAWGGLLIHRDCLEELEQELIDAWFYYQASEMARTHPHIDSPELIREESIRRLVQTEYQIRRAATEDCIAPRATLLEYHLFAALDYLVQFRARRAEDMKGVVA